MQDMFIDLAKYRIQRAIESKADAVLLLKADNLTETANRVYQANYYAVKSLLATRMKDSTKHQRVLNMFQELFVQTGDVPNEYGLIVDRSYHTRDEGDRPDQFQVNREDAARMIGESERFICFVREYLKQLIMANPRKGGDPMEGVDECKEEH
ncbi:MAG: HEPN domain-containing protein [Candidatus Glassbacteria bacterium]